MVSIVRSVRRFRDKDITSFSETEKFTVSVIRHTKYGGTKHFIAEFSPKNPDNFLHDLEDAMTSFRTKAEREGMIFTPRVVLSPKVSGTVKEALFEMGVRLIERQ